MSHFLRHPTMRTASMEANRRVWLAASLLLMCLAALIALRMPRLIENSRTLVPITLATTADESERRPGTNQAGAAYPADAGTTIVDLQQFRQTKSVRISSGERDGTATLVNLNPTIGAWYVLTVAWNGSAEGSYHLHNPAPLSQTIMLDEKFSSGIVIVDRGSRHPCNLFSGSSANALDQARSSQSIFSPLCEGRIYLRNPAKGQRTELEAATEFLRNQVWGGEKVIVLFHHLMEDSHRESGKLSTEANAPGSARGTGTAGGLPQSALIDPKYSDRAISSTNMGIQAADPERNGLRPGEWYAASGNPGVYISMLEPNFVDPQILQSYKARVNSLDGTEASSLCYLVAFDLDQFELAYALGTEYPGVGWSQHILPQMRDPRLPGPDGIGNIGPLVSTGLISPEDARRTVATFTGGFKREHGAFKYGDLAQKNHGSHYGFIEDGVVFSKLQPGLATILVFNDGKLEMKTWEEADNGLLSRVKYARQNGVSLVEFDEASHSTAPGALVNRWGPGNWSGSEDMKLRTIRAGVGLQRSGGKQFLVYAVFSDATPSAMARIFQAYQCQYAMLLDMNALEHTYLAVYRRSDSKLYVDHLIQGMSQVEKSSGGEIVPRFLGYPDNRDFFYLMRRNPQ